ncbi:MAG: hypothetical protein WCJ74_00560 [bacterium]
MTGSNDLLITSLGYIWLVAPIWLPFLLGYVAWEIFVRYNRRQFFASQKYSLLEIRVPKEVAKSPVAMELFLNTVWQTSGESTWYDRNFLGKTRAWFSLEIVSIDGHIHFFIWTRASWQKHIESQIYAQYPGAEVSFVEDYAKKIPEYDPNVISMFGAEYKLTKADPYPIRTYVDFGLHETATKEEQKVDPISQVLEFLGQLGKDEQFWFQIICRAHKDEDIDSSKRIWWKPQTWNATKDNWKDDAIAEVKKIRKENTTKYIDPVTKKEQEGFPNLTKGQMEIISALERSISKVGFDVGLRSIYLAPKEIFNGTNIPMLMGLMKPFNSPTLNGFKPTNHTGFDYPWQDWNNIRVDKMKRDLLFGYQKRSYFFPPNKEKHYVLNAEELATIFHFPGTVVGTPTLGRLLSKKAEPPSNLPT